LWQEAQAEEITMAVIHALFSFGGFRSDGTIFGISVVAM
jgi:hypothetical protein